MWRSVRDRALAKPTDRRADGVKAVSRRRRGRVAPALSPGRPRVYFYTVASRGPGFLAPVIPEKLASQELDTSVGASEPHDFSVRFAGAPVLRTEKRPSHPAPNVRDDREAPLFVRAGRCSLYCCFYQTEKRNIFRRGTRQENCRTAHRANQGVRRR